MSSPPEGVPIPPPRGGGLSRERVVTWVLLLATVGGIYLCFRIAQPFASAIIWAVALSVVGRPVHQAIASRVSYRSLAAGISVTLATVLLAAPAVVVSYQLFTGVSESVRPLEEWEQRVEQLIGQNHRWTRVLDWIEENLNVVEGFERFLADMGERLSWFVNRTAWFLVQFMVMLLVLFYLFRDERRMLAATKRLLPLSAAEAGDLLNRVNDTIHATIYGTLVVAFVQGALGGLMFWWLGLPAPLLWGLIMALLAVIPYLGAFVIWGPAAIFLALEGSWGRALILTSWGSIVVGLSDNLLYPILVGRRLRQHTLIEFFAIVGGLMVFGAAGIVLGPVIVTVTLALIEVWERRTLDGAIAEEAVHG